MNEDEFTPKYIDEFGDPVPSNVLKPFYTEIDEMHYFSGKLLCRVDDRAVAIKWKLDANSKIISLSNITASGIRSIWRDHKNEIKQFILDSINERNLLNGKTITIDDIKSCDMEPF